MHTPEKATVDLPREKKLAYLVSIGCFDFVVGSTPANSKDVIWIYIAVSVTTGRKNPMDIFSC